MTADQDQSVLLVEAVQEAASERRTLVIKAGGSKAFYGRACQGTVISIAGHRGIISYEPTELVVTARAGTPLVEIEAVLAEHGQMLPFEPPHYGEGATLGGTLACGLSGPRRPYLGAARDFTLGTRVVNGKGESLRFGGEVMKNVAGYDVSRLMVGAQGTLGIILDASLKVLPRPAMERTVVREENAADALALLHGLGSKPHPLSGTAYDGARLYVRLSGAQSAVSAAAAQIGGETLHAGEAFWTSVREHSHPFFGGDEPLWRLSVPPTAANPEFPGSWFIEWGGAQRWFCGQEAPEAMWGAARELGGHATLYRHASAATEKFQPLPEALTKIHRNLKMAFDPNGILNRNRLCADW